MFSNLQSNWIIQFPTHLIWNIVVSMFWVKGYSDPNKWTSSKSPFHPLKTKIGTACKWTRTDPDPDFITPCTRLCHTLYQTLSHNVPDFVSSFTKPCHTMYQTLSHLVLAFVAQCLEVFEKYFLFFGPTYNFKCRKMISTIRMPQTLLFLTKFEILEFSPIIWMLVESRFT